MFINNIEAVNQIYNVSFGERITINGMLETLEIIEKKYI